MRAVFAQQIQEKPKGGEGLGAKRSRPSSSLGVPLALAPLRRAAPAGIDLKHAGNGVKAVCFCVSGGTLQREVGSECGKRLTPAGTEQGGHRVRKGELEGRNLGG